MLDRVTGNQTYEARFMRALNARVRPGDVVWDIGANVGMYTQQFAHAVGRSGRVIAFEPAPTKRSSRTLSWSSVGCPHGP